MGAQSWGYWNSSIWSPTCVEKTTVFIVIEVIGRLELKFRGRKGNNRVITLGTSSRTASFQNNSKVKHVKRY